MKKNYLGIGLVAFAFICASILISCKEDELDLPEEAEAPTLNEFSPLVGRIGEKISIKGSGFGTSSDAVAVYFNDVRTTSDSVNNNEVIVYAPSGATTGLITVSYYGTKVTFDEEFTYLPSPKAVSVSPEAGESGETVTIEGENFSTVLSDVKVYFTGADGDIEAVVVSATETTIVAEIPKGGVTGFIKVQIGPESVEGPTFTFPFVGIDEEFDVDAGGWEATASGTSSSIAEGMLTVDFGGGNEGELTYNESVLIDPITFPILAIKSTRLADFDFSLNTDLGVFGGEANKFNGILYGDVYYWDLTSDSFVDGGTETTIDDKTIFTMLQFAVSKTSLEPDFDIEFIRSFENVEKLEEYVQLDVGHYVFEFDKDTEVELEMDMAAFARDDDRPVNIQEDSKLKVTFHPDQFLEGNVRRADLNYCIVNTHPRGNSGGPWATDPSVENWRDSWIFHKDYPILAMKFTKPEVLNGARDWRFNDTTPIEITDGSGDNFQPYSDAVDVYYWDLLDPNSPGGQYVDESLLTAEGTADWGLWSIKMTGITSNELGYEVDWIRTFKTTQELDEFLQYR